MKHFLFVLMFSVSLAAPAMADELVPSSTDHFRQIAGERQYSQVFLWPRPSSPESKSVLSSTNDFRAVAGSRNYYQSAFVVQPQLDREPPKIILSSTDDFRKAAGRAQYSGWVTTEGKDVNRVAASDISE